MKNLCTRKHAAVCVMGQSVVCASLLEHWSQNVENNSLLLLLKYFNIKYFYYILFCSVPLRIFCSVQKRTCLNQNDVPRHRRTSALGWSTHYDKDASGSGVLARVHRVRGVHNRESCSEYPDRQPRGNPLRRGSVRMDGKHQLDSSGGLIDSIHCWVVMHSDHTAASTALHAIACAIVMGDHICIVRGCE